MEKLNKDQELAVKTTEGYVRVISGAGSGKTRIITNRYIYLANILGVANANILCVTFTNNASKEMKQRIDKIIKDKDVGYICTFHSLAQKALREDIHCIGIVPNFTIMDNEDQNLIFKKIYKRLEITNRKCHYEDMRAYISMMKSTQYLISNSDNTINYIECLAENTTRKPFEEPVLEINEKFFNEYIAEQRQNSILDYNDLINIFLYILIKYDEKRLKWQKRFQYIMCDEFNDIDYKQYQLLKILSGFHKNLMIVGDPDQTIYSWRGSDVNYIINFDKEFPNVKDIVVSTNYRSVPSILNNANSLIKHNENRLDKLLVPNRVGEDKVIYNTLKNAQEEAKYVVEQIKQLKDNGTDLSDIAVLYRNNNLSRNVEEILISESINYKVYSGIDFYSRKEIKDILSYLRFILYEKDIDFLRIINSPTRGIGNKKLEYLTEYSSSHNCTLYEALKLNEKSSKFAGTKAKDFMALIEQLQKQQRNLSVSELLNELLHRSGYKKQLEDNNEQERLENIEELKHGIVEFEKTDIEEKTLQEYLDKISLFTNNDRPKDESAVKLMSIHASKGLEFKNVFLIRLNDGIIPSGRTKSQEGIEEERRLCYVAITRAEDRLYLTDVQFDYNNYDNLPSRFLKELDKADLEYVTDEAKDRINTEPTTTNSENLSAEITLNIGDKVSHFVFGNGVIQDIDYQNKTYVIKFDDFETTRNISAHINLEKIN